MEKEDTVVDVLLVILVVIPDSHVSLTQAIRAHLQLYVC